MTEMAVSVFISYSHDSASHKLRVRELADRLRQDGIDCHLDQYEEAPPEGWPAWMKNQIAKADFVLVVCTQTYCERFENTAPGGVGQGARWEGAILTQEIYENDARNERFIPVVFLAEDAVHIPTILRPTTRYVVGNTQGYDDVYRRLTAQPKVRKPPLGAVRTLGPEEATLTSAVDEQLALLIVGGSHELIPLGSVESGATKTIVLCAESTSQSAFLADLQDGFNRVVSIAYDLTSATGSLEEITKTRDGGRESWTLRLGQAPPSRVPDVTEMSTQSLSADDIAEMRARRLLLDEPPNTRVAADPMLNALVAGMQGDVKIDRSPFPGLYAAMKADPGRFLTFSKLLAVHLLRESRTVEHVLSLDLGLDADGRLSVSFEGRRRRSAVNVEPRVISFEGACELRQRA